MAKKLKKNEEISQVSLESQERLAEIMNDSPRLVSLNGTEWEIKALRMGTQWLISKKCIEVAKAENATFGDIIKQFTTNIPSVVEVLVLALLNDKKKIYKDGDEGNGFSDLYYATYNTLMWDCKVEQFVDIFLSVLQMLDVSFFMESCRILEIFRESTMARKNQNLEQK
jgi:hypothetical protein